MSTILTERMERKIVRVPFSGCWIWMGASGERYGLMWAGRKRAMAHRAVLTTKGIEIPPGMEVMHSCDVGFCVNPDHLSVGTHQDNMTDMVRKGRARAPVGDDHWTRSDPDRARAIARLNIVRSHASGFHNGNAKVTPTVIEQVRKAHCAAPALSMQELGKPHGIGRETARKIVKGIAPWTL